MYDFFETKINFFGYKIDTIREEKIWGSRY